MERCKGCVYGKFPKVPSPEIKQCDIAIVGEAASTSDIARKTLFTGPAAQVLDKVLATTSLPRKKDIFMTQALLCLPPKNKPQIKDAIKHCQARLIDELEQVKPKLIIALGNIAMHALTDDYDLKITKVQGRVLSSPFLPGVKIIPVLHPAAILRAPGDYKLFYTAMHHASKEYTGESYEDSGQVIWQVVDSHDKMKQVVKFLSTKEVVAADIETTGLNPYKDSILVLGLCYAKNKAIVVKPEFITQELFDIPALWVWHNGKFDTQFLKSMGFRCPINDDTMLQSYVLNEQSGIHDLGQLATRELGAEAYKHKVKEKIGKGTFADLKEEDLFERVATDVDYTFQIHHKLWPRIKASEALSSIYLKVLVPASEFLATVERAGMPVNLELLEEYQKEYEENLAQLNEEILEIAMPFWDPARYMADTDKNSAPKIFNPGSTYQVAWLLFDVLKLKPKGRRKGRSTDKEILQAMQGQHVIVDKMLEHRSVSKELSTYILGVKKYVDESCRVHTTYKLHGTVTGRLSSSEPNIQNQPKRKPKVRNIFQAPSGRKFLEIDYKGAELRVLAHVSKDEFLTKCFVEGRDLHTEVEKALNIPRIRAKAVNFGIAYGRTEYSIAEEFGIPVEEARGYILDWFERMPGAKEYLDACDRAAIEGKTLVTPFGRHRRFGLVTPETLKELQNEARNFVIQSVASDLTLLSAMEMAPMIEKLNARIINLVHDSILIECPDIPTVIRHVAHIAKTVMFEVPKTALMTEVPFEVEFSYGTQWGDLKEVQIDEIL